MKTKLLSAIFGVALCAPVMFLATACDDGQPTISDIVVNQSAVRTVFMEGDDFTNNFQSQEMVVKQLLSNEEEQLLESNEYTVDISQVDAENAGEYDITITFEDFVKTIKIEIKNPADFVAWTLETAQIKAEQLEISSVCLSGDGVVQYINNNESYLSYSTNNSVTSYTMFTDGTYYFFTQGNEPDTFKYKTMSFEEFMSSMGIETEDISNFSKTFYASQIESIFSTMGEITSANVDENNSLTFFFNDGNNGIVIDLGSMNITNILWDSTGTVNTTITFNEEYTLPEIPTDVEWEQLQ